MISAIILINILIKTEDKVEGYINSVIVWTLLCFTMTESLSVFRAISTVNLWLCWIGIDAVLLVLNLFIIFIQIKCIDKKLPTKKTKSTTSNS